MDNPFQEQGLLNWIMGVIVTLLTGLAALFHGRVRVLEEGHRQLLTSTVTKAELENYMKTFVEQRKEMHGENRERFDRVEAALQRIHGRIDDIPFRSASARTRVSDRP